MEEQLNKENEGKERKVLTKKRILFVLFLLLVGIAVFLGFMLKNRKDEDDKQKKVIEKVQEEKKKKGVKKLHKKYKDMIGWVEIEGTDFSYPVMQTGLKGHHEEDWMYYLHKDVYENYSFYGTPFLDVRCTTDSDNLIIYGHNINGRRYFGYLQNFRTEEFFRKHKSFSFTKVNDVKTDYQVVSVIETTKYASYYDFTDYGNVQEYADAVSHILSGSKFNNDMNEQLKKELNENTVEAFFHKYQFVSLSTCRTSEGRDKRLLVIGYRERKLIQEQ